jgi:hypothetical protein
MSKSDYINIAGALREARSQCLPGPERTGFDRAVRAIGEMYARRTAMFDINLFLKNAGVPTT